MVDKVEGILKIDACPVRLTQSYSDFTYLAQPRRPPIVRFHPIRRAIFFHQASKAGSNRFFRLRRRYQQLGKIQLARWKGARRV